MAPVTFADAASFIAAQSGPVDPGRVTLFSTMRDEMAFLPAFLAHYRALGFEQFLIIDDGSGDGTGAYLRAQPDCVVLETTLPYGAEITIEVEGAVRAQRAGIYYKMALPHVFFDGAYVTYVDADEFLILPPGVAGIGEVIARLAAGGDASCVASVVEFFPADTGAFDAPMPGTAEGLFAAYPWFQPEPLVRLRAGEAPELVGQAKTARLFRRYGVRPTVERRGWHRLYLPAAERKRQEFQKSPRHKTPIVKRGADSWLKDTHNANRPPSAEVLLTVAHFVFTSDFAAKIARARAWGAHANGAAKYRYYAELLERMRGVENGFLDAASERLKGPEQLIAAGLMRW